MKQDLDAVLATFQEGSAVHFQATMEGDYKRANRAAERIHRAFLRLRDLGPTAREALLQVGMKGADAAAVMAATYSLKYDAERALAALKRLSALDGILGFQAGEAVKRWKSGEWQLE